jgi:sec-independent protein translocase protein TatC
MTLFEHLAELRRRVVICLIALVVTATVSFLIYSTILHFLMAPLCQIKSHCQLYVTAPLDGLSIRVKIATYGGVFLALPLLLWQLWGFVTPGLRKKERRYALIFVGSAVLLFTLGAFLAYWCFPHALRFLSSVGGTSLVAIYTPNNYVSLLLAIMLIFGVTFEFPVVLVALELAGVLKPAWLAKQRRWAIVLIVTIAAFITPSGDPFSMLALAVPLYVFFEASILIGKYLPRLASEPR